MDKYWRLPIIALKYEYFMIWYCRKKMHIFLKMQTKKILFTQSNFLMSSLWTMRGVKGFLRCVCDKGLMGWVINLLQFQYEWKIPHFYLNYELCRILNYVLKYQLKHSVMPKSTNQYHDLLQLKTYRPMWQNKCCFCKTQWLVLWKLPYKSSSIW